MLLECLLLSSPYLLLLSDEGLVVRPEIFFSNLSNDLQLTEWYICCDGAFFPFQSELLICLSNLLTKSI